MYIGYIIKFWELTHHALLLSVLFQFLIAAKKEGEGKGVHGQVSLIKFENLLSMLRYRYQWIKSLWSCQFDISPHHTYLKINNKKWGRGIPDGTRRCNNVRFWLYFGFDVG